MINKKKFVASYSGGKDSALAIYRAIQAGHEPMALLTTYDEKNKHSWFHNIPYLLLQEISKSVDIPITLVNTGAESYTSDFEKALLSLKEQGAQMCVFGDIDIQEHFDWCNNRCENVGLEGSFPLWKSNRRELVHEVIDVGFKTLITVINTDRVNESHIGKVLTYELIEQLEKENVDVCGENGEYHTFVFDGPIFKKPIEFKQTKIVRIQNQIRALIQEVRDETV